jgi:hypothetical protein
MEYSWTETSQLNKAINFLINYKKQNCNATKESLSLAFIKEFNPKIKRSLYMCNDFCIRFCEVNTNNFTGTVLCLSALKQVDHNPIIACIVKKTELNFYLINSTFIKKVSHSSKGLTLNKVKGSFNGSDVIINYFGIKNEKGNFQKLFAEHRNLGWKSNFERIVKETSNIEPKKNKFLPSNLQRENILNAPNNCDLSIKDGSFNSIKKYLDEKVNNNKILILNQANNENNKTRGDNIESIITCNKNDNNLGDLNLKCRNWNFSIDIKTHIIGKNSSPKVYNIDKMLSFISDKNNIFLLYFLQIDILNGEISTKLVSIFDDEILNSTRIQTHWSGIDSRGTTQLSSMNHKIFDSNYNSIISLEKARSYLNNLLN